MQRTLNRARLSAGLAITILVAACGGAAPQTLPPPTPAAPTPTAATPGATTAATAGATASAAPAATTVSTGPATLEAVQEIEAGKTFQITWTGPNAPGDYVTIVQASAAKWTVEPYFYTTSGSPGTLTAPSGDGAYALWYVSGTDDSILVRRAIRVTPFKGDLLGADTVQAGSQFEVAWNGPNGPRDYVTIVKLGAAKWTNESYFYTTAGSPGKLTASIEPGAYELWYVIGSDDSIKARRAITVSPYVVTLEAPKEVARGAQFKVTWTGPDGPSDYITIAPAGSPVGTYLSYAYTTAGSPATIMAPPEAGQYEVRYASDRVKITFKSVAITVK
jgi:Ca-activated chloride channel family protein